MPKQTKRSAFWGPKRPKPTPHGHSMWADKHDDSTESSSSCDETQIEMRRGTLPEVRRFRHTPLAPPEEMPWYRRIFNSDAIFMVLFSVLNIFVNSQVHKLVQTDEIAKCCRAAPK